MMSDFLILLCKMLARSGGPQKSLEHTLGAASRATEDVREKSKLTQGGVVRARRKGDC